MGVWARGLVVALGLVLAGCADVRIPSNPEKPYVSLSISGGLTFYSSYWMVNDSDTVLHITNTYGRVDDKRSTRHISGSYQRTVDLLLEGRFETLNSLCVTDFHDPRQVFFPPDSADIALEWHRLDRTVVFRRLYCGRGLGISADYVDAFESLVEEILDIADNARH